MATIIAFLISLNVLFFQADPYAPVPDGTETEAPVSNIGITDIEGI